MREDILTFISVLGLIVAFALAFFAVAHAQGEEEEILDIEDGELFITAPEFYKNLVVSKIATLAIQVDEDYTIEQAIDDLFNNVLFDQHFDPDVAMTIRKVESREITIESPCGTTHKFTPETFPRESLECSCETGRSECYVVWIR